MLEVGSYFVYAEEEDTWSMIQQSSTEKDGPGSGAEPGFSSFDGFQFPAQFSELYQAEISTPSRCVKRIEDGGVFIPISNLPDGTGSKGDVRPNFWVTGGEL